MSHELTSELWNLEDEGKGKWSQPLPAMPTARSVASAVRPWECRTVAGRGGSVPHHPLDSYQPSSVTLCLHADCPP